jgi:hypothetical protein
MVTQDSDAAATQTLEKKAFEACVRAKKRLLTRAHVLFFAPIRLARRLPRSRDNVEEY